MKLLHYLLRYTIIGNNVTMTSIKNCLVAFLQKLSERRYRLMVRDLVKETEVENKIPLTALKNQSPATFIDKMYKYMGCETTERLMYKYMTAEEHKTFVVLLADETAINGLRSVLTNSAVADTRDSTTQCGGAVQDSPVLHEDLTVLTQEVKALREAIQTVYNRL